MHGGFWAPKFSIKFRQFYGHKIAYKYLEQNLGYFGEFGLVAFDLVKGQINFLAKIRQIGTLQKDFDAVQDKIVEGPPN